MDSPTRRKSGKVIITIKAGINKEKLKNCFMKRNLLLSGLFVAAFFCGCADDISDGGDNKGVANPVKEGSEILFGSSLSTDVDDIMSKASRIETRTVYGDRTKTGVPVYWAPEGDEVAIFCAQASQPASRLVNYIVKPQAENPYVSESVTKVNPAEAGLQWGSADEHHFYAFYPASAVKAADEDDQDGVITASIPVNQMPESWRVGDIDGVKTYFGLPNMDYAYMYAFSTYKKSQTEEGTTIDLQFKNLVTVLDITVQGPESGAPIEISNINVRAVDGANVILTGDFNCNIRTANPNSKEVTAECTAAGDLNEVRNNISISCYNGATDEFIKLAPGEQLNVKAYLIPDDDQSHIIQPRQLQVRVITLNGAPKVRTLQTAEVVPHKINRIRLPKLEAGGINYWMSSLDRNIYLSELSIPGSKFSYNTSANSAKPVYQGADIKTQFMDGVRAFIAPVDVKGVTYNGTRTGDWWTGYDYSHEYVVSETPGSPLKINGISGTTTLVNTIEDIAEGLQKSEDELGAAAHECAVVMITKPGSVSASDVNFTGEWESRLDGSRFNTVGGDYTVWIEAVANELQALSKDASKRIYTGEITANTTLEDVRGKIILKINYNDVSQEAVFASSARYPMLFSRWDGLTKTVPLYWGTMAQAASLKWMYHESTHVGSAGEAGIPNTAAIKLSNVNAIFTNSIDAYLGNDAHDTWYMNDCGGVFTGSVSGTDDYDGTYSEDNNSVIALTKWMNREVRQTLQKRTENASTGLVFFNFADKQAGSGVEYETNELIQTIIDNNFKFALRKAGESGTTTNSSDASYSEGGPVWR